ncbi:type III restriction-modification system endonuclease [Vibrio cholerae]|uniref:type III restriction-modification system endonuclease n=1 Tax=Vibrio harveyi group TaxID=717610 RepID=UPI001C83F4B1|nr:type III restriction-modification system endonuclease [Vibrio parahaemolyticus]EGR0027618.1 type III restriction-modification system endonuclease [Vibrio alginolyticus]EJP3281832.1 type III restriction-modification system endonuclease [Vibrio parahaemolyticus]MBX5374650.1 type III restriction-modification system endonuclease [Vibrio parahaemolyticus]HCG7222340.1 type III restriction-modification system endonuclease [Vibrio parahaemolyticus]HCM0682412.1 type III restriction-modification syst
MSKGFSFEKNLPHQQVGVDSVISFFNGADVSYVSDYRIKYRSNPIIKVDRDLLKSNIENIQRKNSISHDPMFYDLDSNVIDIKMETGTGKTYTYTKTIFELNKSFDINKFVIVVPTLSIKAGTVNFLRSSALKEHFRDDYDREIKTYVVDSKKNAGKKGKRNYMPQAIHDFVEADNVNRKHIHVLIINTGMVNSKKSMNEPYDKGLLDNLYDTPAEAISAINPFIIIDEPHKFPKGNATWKNIKSYKPQYIIQYGATFGNDEYDNLLYDLDAIQAFNQGLVKNVDVYIEKGTGEEVASVKLTKVEGKVATFKLTERNKVKSLPFSKGDSLVALHAELRGLSVELIDATQKTVILSNGIEMKAGVNQLNPYAYSSILEDDMMRKAIKRHFEVERELLTQTPRIKPLALFFIDDIEGYRDGNDISGTLKKKFEDWVVFEAKEQLKTVKDEFYRTYLEQTINDVSSVHGGYFSKDNTGADEKVEEEINEILHDKEKLLSLDNPRRFIFSKWTLREGWDNPNVFSICKLRTSGSKTSKLQEVGRGLRLPVNEFMSRVKDRTFALNYFVDFTEQNFVSLLKGEINSASQREPIPTEFDASLMERIKAAYPELSNFNIMSNLINKGIMDENQQFLKDDSFELLKEEYSGAFQKGLMEGKVREASKTKRTSKMRIGMFDELKELWERINTKAILQYKIDSEDHFLGLFESYLREYSDEFKKSGFRTVVEEVRIKNNMAQSTQTTTENLVLFSNISYAQFLEELSEISFIKRSTLHKAFIAVKDLFDIRDYLNNNTIRKINSDFNDYLLSNSFNKFSIGYNIISSKSYPTKFTDSLGNPVDEVSSADLGVHHDMLNTPLNGYLFEDVFYDSELERLNIVEDNVVGVTVFTKIPKNSIKIPVAGGGTYSPDFAYVIKTKQGEFLNFIIESKNLSGKKQLRQEEKQKIAHAEKLFEKIAEDLGGDIKIEFKTQFKDEKIIEIIEPHLS